MSQGGSEATRAFLDAVTLLIKVSEVVMKMYEKNNSEKELEELKKDKDSIIAKKCGAFRGALNKFYEKNFNGEWKDHENKETGQRYKLYEIARDENGTPILKKDSPLYNNAVNLLTKAQAKSKNSLQFGDNLTREFDKFMREQLVDDFKQQLKDTGNKELEKYADTIKDDSDIRGIFEGAQRKAKTFNDDFKRRNASEFFAKQNDIRQRDD